MQHHRQTRLEHLQGGGLDAVVQGQAADDYPLHAVGLEVLDDARGEFVMQVVVTGTVGVQVRLNAFPDEVIVVVGRGQFIQQGEALGARHTVVDPGDIGMRQARGLQHVAVPGHYPGCVRSVRVLAANTMTGKAGHVVELGADLVTAGHWQLIGAQWREAFLFWHLVTVTSA